jgi:hypothetical protein
MSRTDQPTYRGGMQTYFTAPHIRAAPPEVGIALLASDAAREAATQFTAHLMRWRADTKDEDGSLVHGWAPHAAFLAGVKWEQERQQRERQDESLEEQGDLLSSSVDSGS